MFAYQWFCFPDLVLPLSNDGAKLSCKNPKMSECAKTVTIFLYSRRLKSYDKTRNPTIMSRNKAIWIAKLLFRRGQLSREEILAAWASCDENAKPMAPSTFYDNRHLLWERYGINIRVSHGLYSLDLREGREQEFLNQLFYDDEGYDNSDTVIREPRPQAMSALPQYRVPWTVILAWKRFIRRSTSRNTLCFSHPIACVCFAGGAMWWAFRPPTEKFALLPSTAWSLCNPRPTLSLMLRNLTQSNILPTVSVFTAAQTGVLNTLFLKPMP